MTDKKKRQQSMVIKSKIIAKVPEILPENLSRPETHAPDLIRPFGGFDCPHELDTLFWACPMGTLLGRMPETFSCSNRHGFLKQDVV